MIHNSKKMLSIVICVVLLFGSCYKGTIKSSEEESFFNSVVSENPYSGYILEDNTSIEDGLPTFGELEYSQETIGIHTLSDITKIYFYEGTSTETRREIAIDIGNRRLHTWPKISIYLDSNNTDYIMTEEEVEYVLNLLEKYDVLSWGRITTENTESTVGVTYSWVLYIQYSDGTISYFNGYGAHPTEVQPENFNEFVEDMINFTHSRVPNV